MNDDYTCQECAYYDDMEGACRRTGQDCIRPTDGPCNKFKLSGFYRRLEKEHDDKRCETCRYHTPYCCYEDKVKLTGKKGCDAWQQKVQSIADGRAK